jgi:hypothetical protein
MGLQMMFLGALAAGSSFVVAFSLSRLFSLNLAG